MKLSIKNINKKYKNGTVALSDFSLEMDYGIYALIGPNGAGKSTLMNIIIGNIKADSGKIEFNNEDIFKENKKFREILGYVPQKQALYEDFSAEKYLYYIATLKGVEKNLAKERIDNLLIKLDLYEFKDKKIKGYSIGMKQRVLIAQALINDPKVLILDEPTAGLDPRQRINLRNFISEIAMDKIIIFTTHIISDIENISEEIILIKNGILIDKKTEECILENLKGKVFNLKLKSKQELEDVRNLFKVSEISKKNDMIYARIISNENICNFNYEEVNPCLEDVYMSVFEV
ncbi:MAG: ATP-binding cassette domain-containing protein [Sarcina sp.]